MGRHSIYVNTSSDQVNTAFPLMKRVSEWVLDQPIRLTGVLFEGAIKNADTTVVCALGVAVASGNGNENAQGGALLLPPLLAWNEVSNRPNNVFFGGGAIDLPAGAVIGIFASGPNEAATKLSGVATFYFEPAP